MIVQKKIHAASFLTIDVALTTCVVPLDDSCDEMFLSRFLRVAFRKPFSLVFLHFLREKRIQAIGNIRERVRRGFAITVAADQRIEIIAQS